MMNRGILRLLRALGVEAKRAKHNPHIGDFLKSRNIDVVYDVGANAGQFGKYIRDRGYDGRIVSYEPVAGAFEKLASAASRDPKWEIHRLALGDKNGTAQIHVSENTVFSSMLELSALGYAFDKRAHTSRSETVEMKTFDAAVAGLETGRAFLKIDTQGFEKQVLEGAANSLHHILGLQVELPIEHLYEGTWTFAEALNYMAAKGLTLAQVDAVNTLGDDPACVVEFDCLFRRSAAA